MIQIIYVDYKGNYGYRRIHLELRNRGFVINHKKVKEMIQTIYDDHKGNYGYRRIHLELDRKSVV